MSITIKTPEEQQKMREAGRMAADLLDFIAPHIVPGVTTEELDKLCHDYQVNEQKTVPIPTIAGVVAIVVGLGLVFAARTRR